MLSAYNRRLILSYLSNAVSHLECDTMEAKNLTKWFMKHRNKLKFGSPRTRNGKTAISMTRGGNMPLFQWQQLSETLRSELEAAGKARPDRTASRLRRLAKAMSLTRVDTAILQLVLRNHTVPLIESMMDAICERGQWSGTGFALTNPVLPSLLGISTGSFFRRFAPGSPLVTSGLVSIDGDSYVTIIDRLTRLHWQPKTAGTDVQRLLLEGASPARLCWSDFDHVAGDRDHLERILKGALRTGRNGVNVLVHGPPGTGKTEFCKTLAARLEAPLYVVGESDDDRGEPWNRSRLLELRLAQRLLAGNHRSILLFDEMEDLLSTKGEVVAVSPGSHRFPELSAIGSRVTMNRLLEQTPVPILWTSNAARRTSPVLLRRMMFALEMRHPPAKVRGRIWARQLAHHGIESAQEDARSLAREYDLAPGVAYGVTAAAKLGGGTIPEVRRGLRGLARLLSGNKPPISGTPDKYDIALIRADMNPVHLADRLASSGAHHFSLCLQGPPGTGKSAFVRHLAGRLGLELLQKRASDLMSMWVGGTERNIAEAFEEAREDEAFLVFDEADSLLANRRLASRNWEVSHVNEMLTWMESHPLPVAFTTNFREHLDPATLRRFTFKIALDFLSPEQARAAFRTFFGQEAPADISGLVGLTPGDFTVVRRKAEILDCLSDTREVMAMLRAECEAKPDFPRRVGFQS
jgi:hypothetical protein